MNEEPIISQELQALVNVPQGPDVYEIEKGMVKKFVEAIEDPNMRWQVEAPPTFPAALVPTTLLHKLFNAPTRLKRILNGTSELEYFQSIKIGDTISVTGTLTRLRQADGKEGATLFMITEVTYVNQRGEVAVKGKNTYVKY